MTGNNPMSFFSDNVDAWGPLEWFDRLAKAVHARNRSVRDKDELSFELYQNIASSSATRLVSDFEDKVRMALTTLRELGKANVAYVDANTELLSTLESLQRENAVLQERTADYPTISAKLHDREKARDAEQKSCREAIARAEAAEAEVKRLCQVLKPFAEASAWNAEGVDLTQGDRPAFPSDIDLMNLEGNSLTLCDLFDARDALASTGGEDHGN